jgi:hypothetical protein
MNEALLVTLGRSTPRTHNSKHELQHVKDNRGKKFDRVPTSRGRVEFAEPCVEADFLSK